MPDVKNHYNIDGRFVRLNVAPKLQHVHSLLESLAQLKAPRAQRKRDDIVGHLDDAIEALEGVELLMEET